jgi:hypothetical protein
MSRKREEERNTMHHQARHSSKGFALASAMLIVVLLAGISAGTMYLVNTEARLAITDMEGSQAFYGAEAGMEKMMADLSLLYSAILAPTVTDIEGLAATDYQPVISGVSYPEYDFDIPNVSGEPIVEVRTISSGPNEGLLAYITPLTLSVTALAPTASEVKMQREIEMALIPVFQFGLFSETDLSYFPGPGFDFAGRVHTNGSLFLATSSDDGLVFHNKITAVNQVIRAELANGLGTVATGRTDPVLIPTAPGGCDGDPRPACRDLQEDEGSKVGGVASADTAGWTTTSLTTYNGFILNGETGAKAMNLPFIGGGLRAVELIRRPPAAEDPNSLIGKSRMYNMAQIRVLISDTAAENPGGAGVRLANVAPYYVFGSYGLTDTAFAEANKSVDGDYLIDNHTPHVCASGDAAVDAAEGGTNECWSLIDGFLLVQSKQADGSYTDVTLEWLNLGIARENADAILKFQALKDTDKPPDGVPNFTDLPGDLAIPWRSVHLGLYDSREGEVRDEPEDTSSNCAIGGIMNNVELDVGNLKRWFEGTTGTTGTNTDWAPQNGYVFYFSDRRGMLPNGSGVKGEYGFEDMVNPPETDGSPDGLFHNAEDVNQNGVLDTYGGANLGDGFAVSNNDPTIIIDCKDKGRLNRVSGARRGLKLVNGALGNVPTKPDDTGGFTVASENIVYVMGNYNADDAGFGDPHAAASVVADAASFLSKDWEDWRSWRWPIERDNRPATTSYYRLAVAAGKNINFPWPAAWAPNDDPGLDGGTHNFLRYLEAWGGQTFNYRGSLVSLYYSEYATGIYKCCRRVYGPPTRAYAFDTDFLELDKLPPGTPRFRDVVNLGFRQVLIPD